MTETVPTNEISQNHVKSTTPSDYFWLQFDRRSFEICSRCFSIEPEVPFCHILSFRLDFVSTVTHTTRLEFDSCRD